MSVSVQSGQTESCVQMLYLIITTSCVLVLSNYSFTKNNDGSGLRIKKFDC